MSMKFASASILLGWQVVALILSLTGQVDSLLMSVPDPNWFVVLWATIVAPPAWLVWLVVTGAILLIISAQRDERQKAEDAD